MSLPNAKSARKSRPTLGELLLLLAAIVFGLLTVELALRAIGYANPLYHRPDADRGWMPWENLRIAIGSGSRTGFRFNADGIRGPARDRQAADGVYRVAVLGDSFTEAREVAYERTFVARFESTFAGCPLLHGRRLEVLNFGVSGFGTTQSLIDYRLRVREFRPDLVLLAFFAGNDVSNNSRELDGHENRPFFALNAGELAAPPPDSGWSILWRSLRARLYNTSRVWQLTEQARRIIKYDILKLGSTPANPMIDALRKDDWVMAPPRDASWQEAWRLTEALLTELRDAVKADGAEFALSLVTIPVQVLPDAGKRARVMDLLGVDDLSYPNARLARWAQHERVALVDPLPDIRAEVARTGVYLHGYKGHLGTGHYTEAGHALFGRLLGQGLCAALSAAPRARRRCVPGHTRTCPMR